MKKCKQGYYYCFTDKKCKKMPVGYHIGSRGMLEKDNEGEDSNGNKKNGNGNGNGNSNGGSNGSGNGSGNGGNGGGVSEGWSEKYKKSIDCNNPKGFSQKAHCRGKMKVNTEGTLHKWFKGSKSKDGKGGWVNVVTGGTCASDEPGEGTPKCVSSAKRASMTKAERLSAARRKKKADPGQQQKSGAAKPTYVSTDPKKKMKKEEVEVTEAKDKKGKGSGTKDACYHKVKSRYSVWPSAYASGALVKCRKVGAANWGNSTRKESFEFSNWRDDFKALEYEFTDIIKAEPIKGGQEQIDEAKKCWKGYKKVGTQKLFGKTYNRCVKASEEVENKIGGGNIKKLTDKAINRVDADVDGDVDTKDMKSQETGEFVPSTSGKKLKPKVKFEHSDWRSEIEEGAAWTKKSGKNPSGGLNEKGRKSYERENPGSDLKAPSKKVGNKRRASFCARMKGMKKKLTSAKTARDPDSRINKSLRAWNC